VVALAETKGKKLDQLTPEDLKSVSDVFEADALKVFSLKTALAQRNLPGAPGTREVKLQLRRWQRALAGKH
jgi:argininosuccinate lyase